jgi:hypothetical protein
MRKTMGDFFGLPTGILENEFVRLEYLSTCGPRIVWFSLNGGPNLLAEIPDIFVETSLGPFYFRGGHRLWRSPELMPETYSPDNDGLEVQNINWGVKLSHRANTGIAKGMEIQMDSGKASVTVTQQIYNEGSQTVKLSPWGITMFRQGGTAILPQPLGNNDPHGLLNNRVLAFWPYTHINDPRLIMRDDIFLIHANPALPPLKIGYYNPHGWLGYWMDNTLFRKKFKVSPGAPYPDGGCNSESFCNDRFVELECLGPLVSLEPGAATTLVETWELYDTLDVPFIPKQIRKIME